MREALSAMIGALPGFEVVAEVGTDAAALEAARAWRPTLALVDQDGPGCCGAWTMQALLRDELVRAIVGIGLRADGGRRATAAGALAYVQIGASPEDVCAALRTALQGVHSRRPSRNDGVCLPGALARQRVPFAST